MLNSRILTVVLVALLTVLSVHLVDQGLDGVRADVTEGDLYSLSGGMREILERMGREGVEPVTVTLYFSETTGKTLPRFIKEFITYERYLRHLLREVERVADGRIEVRFVDPVTDSDAEQRALEVGLDGRPINQHGDLFFFGLVLETRTGSREIIEFLWPERQQSIEYEIARRLVSLLWPSSQRVGVISSLEPLGSATNPYVAQMMAAQGRQPKEKWVALSLLEQRYPVESIPLDSEEISPEQFDLLLVIHPKALPVKTRWAIDQWIVRGGNAMILVDPYALEDQPPPNPREPWAAFQHDRASDLGDLLGAWGVERPRHTVAADLELAVQRPVRRRGPAESVVVDLALEADDLEARAEGHPVLQGLGRLRFLLAGDLRAGESAEGVRFEPLLTTTPDGGTLEILPGIGGSDGELHYSDLNDAARLRDALEPAGRAPVLAALVRGRLPSAFPEGVDFPDRLAETPPGWPPGVPPPTPEDAVMVHRDPVPEEERAEASVLLVADVDLISDAIAFQQNVLGIVQATNDNHKLFLNAVDWLLGSGELMAVRARGAVERPFTRFDEIEAAAEQETLERERQLRAEIEGVEEELRQKQNEITQRNAVLFQKKLQDEVDRLNERIAEANRELRQIRQERRVALESEERRVRISVLGWMPGLVLLLGLVVAVRRRLHQRRSGGGER